MSDIIPYSAPRQFGARRKGDVRDITVCRKVKRNAVFLGAGRFTNAFLHGRDVYLFTHYGDYSKEILWQCNERPRNPHIPVMERIDVLDGPKYADWDIYVYRSRYYEMPLSANTGRAWQDYKALRLVREKAHWLEPDKRVIDTDRCRNINYYVSDNAKITAKALEALKELADGCANYGDNYLFDDFRARNLGTDERGRLVFVDPVFNAEIVNKDILARQNRRIRYGY